MMDAQPLNRREVMLGLFLLVAMLVITACCFTGAYVIGRWIWSVV